MATEFDKRQAKTATYVLVLAVQAIAALVFVWTESPSFRELALNPGRQIADIPLDDLATAGILLVMQGTYWYRLRRIPIPLVGPNTLFHHILLFMGRLSFIFGGAVPSSSSGIFRSLARMSIFS